MRLATITNWAYGATVALTLASGTTMLVASGAQDRERAAVAQRHALDDATSTIDEDAALLSALARQFAISGSAADLVAYRQEAAQLGSVESRTRHIRDAGAGADELASLHAALHWADALRSQQQAAIAARLADDRGRAIDILFSPEYERELDRIQTAIERFQYRIDQRTDTTLRGTAATARIWQAATEVTLGVTGLLFLCVIYFVFRRRVLRPVVKLSDVVTRLAAQDYDAVPPHYSQVDEIGDMAEALRVFRETGLERQRLERERDADRAIRDLLSRMTQRMQSCDTIDDLTRVIQRFLPTIAPHLAGILYLLDPARGAMVEASSWQKPVHSQPEFVPLACWALRRGAMHRPAGDQLDVPCSHLQDIGKGVPDIICLPLIGQNGTLGLLYLEPAAGGCVADLPDIYLRMLAENIGMALDNLRLREALRDMAMADALTTLANRRQLDERLEPELARSAEAGTPISCIMADIDHFKHVNDEVGHDAGDAVLREVGRLLKESVREENLVFRYGGEEFLLLLPGMELSEAAARAEAIRAAVADLVIRYNGRELGPVTMSLGVAAAPMPSTHNRLVQTADAALLRAKRNGRNRVEIARPRGLRRA